MNARDECATEALEIATYDYLEAAAKAADDAPTARLAAEHRADEERMLRDLRKLIPKLALAAMEKRTTIENATLSTTTTRRSSSGRATSRGTKRSSSGSTRKASTAKRSTSTAKRRSTTTKKTS